MSIQIIREIEVEVKIEKNCIWCAVVMIREKEDFCTKRLILEIGVIKNKNLFWFKEDEIIRWSVCPIK